MTVSNNFSKIHFEMSKKNWISYEALETNKTDDEIMPVFAQFL